MTPDELVAPIDYFSPPGYCLKEFEIVRVLGEGGFGLVYLAYDRILKQQRAIKEFLPHAVAQRNQGSQRVSARSGECGDIYEEGLRSFINEGRLLASLDHPSVVRVYRCIEANNTAYLVMHFYEGETLKKRLRRFGGATPDADWVARTLVQILRGLQVIHGHGVLYRDIKPDNIYLPADERPVLIDFGAARRVVGGRTKALTGIITEGYSPIEQYTDDSGFVEGSWSQLQVGQMYRFGVGVPQDYKEAYHRLRKTAEQGNAERQIALGELYQGGLGIEKIWRKQPNGIIWHPIKDTTVLASIWMQYNVNWRLCLNPRMTNHLLSRTGLRLHI